MAKARTPEKDPETLQDSSFDELHLFMQKLANHPDAAGRVPAITCKAKMNGELVQILHVAGPRITIPFSTNISAAALLETIADAIVAWTDDRKSLFESGNAGTLPAADTLMAHLPFMRPCEFRERFIALESTDELDIGEPR